MTHLGPLNFFLGISVSRIEKGMFLSQKKYATDLLDHSNMFGRSPCRTLIDISSKFRFSSLDATPVAISDVYTSRHFFCCTTDLPIYALFIHDPCKPHLYALNYILHYLHSTLDHGLHMYATTTSKLLAYSDADWGGCRTTRRSTSG